LFTVPLAVQIPQEKLGGFQVESGLDPRGTSITSSNGLLSTGTWKRSSLECRYSGCACMLQVPFPFCSVALLRNEISTLIPARYPLLPSTTSSTETVPGKSCFYRQNNSSGLSCAHSNKGICSRFWLEVHIVRLPYYRLLSKWERRISFLEYFARVSRPQHFRRFLLNSLVFKRDISWRGLSASSLNFWASSLEANRAGLRKETNGYTCLR
jgi:hypothetical protein